MDSDGNLGIGCTPTNSTNYKTLDIRDTSGGQIILGRTTSMDTFLYSTSTSSHLGSSTGQALVFHTNSTGASNERMRITSGGTIKIGDGTFKLVQVMGNVCESTRMVI